MAENTASYLTVLLNDNENLKNWLTSYLNLEISIKAKYGDVKTDLTKEILPEEKKSLVDTISLFRAYATRIKVSIDVIKNKFPENITNEIEEDYKIIKSAPLPAYDVCERYVQNINNELNKQLKVASTFTSQN